MKACILFCLLVMALCSQSVAQEHVVEVTIESLSRDEIREGVKRLREYKIVREDLAQREHYITQLEEIAKQRESLRVDTYKLAMEKLKVAEDQRDVEREKAGHYKALYDEISKKRTGGFKCGLRAVFSLGLSRCS